MSDLKKVNDEIAEAVTGGYQKIERGVVGAFQKVGDKFVGELLTREGETIEEAKARLAEEQKACEGTARAEAERRAGQP